MDVDAELTALTREFAALAGKSRSSKEFSNLSVLSIRVLSFLYFRNDLPTMREIAEAIGISMPSTTVIVGKLEQQKLVLRKAKVGDRRIIQPRLTAHGRNIIQNEIRKSEGILKAALQDLSDVDKDIVLKFFKAYIKAAHDSLADQG